MLFDTYAWVELFNNTQKANLVLDLLKREEPATAIPTISEVASWALKNKLEPKPLITYLERESTILAITPEIALLAGEIHFQIKRFTPTFGMVDAMIYATAL